MVLAVFVGACRSAWAQTTPTAADDPEVMEATAEVAKAQAQVQGLKDAWDRSRLESTLYAQRAQRAYKRWAAAKGDWKKKMAQHRDQAQWEFELAVERRKLAYDLWQEAQCKLQAKQQLLAAAEQADDIQAVRDHIRSLEAKLAPLATPPAAPTPTP